jgi:hypothetical protein
MELAVDMSTEGKSGFAIGLKAVWAKKQERLEKRNEWIEEEKNGRERWRWSNCNRWRWQKKGAHTEAVSEGVEAGFWMKIRNVSITKGVPLRRLPRQQEAGHDTVRRPRQQAFGLWPGRLESVERKEGSMDDSDDMQDLADFDASEFDVDAGASRSVPSCCLSLSLTALLLT